MTTNETAIGRREAAVRSLSSSEPRNGYAAPWAVGVAPVAASPTGGVVVLAAHVRRRG